MRGFTLIELLITVAIVAVLASIALPLSEMAVTRTKEQDLRRALRDIRDALDAYKRASDEGRIPRSAEQSGYPPNLGVLVQGVRDAKSPETKRIYFLRRIPRDPFFPDETVLPENTWRVRSYESPADQPASGQDVYDVLSSNERKGLNGIPYSEW